MVERTGGVPLFVEELTRAVLESTDAKLTGHQIPETLHDSLMARLDRLGPAREVAHVGAVIGSEFSYELLHAVHPLNQDDLQEALRKLADAELIYVHGIPPEANYTFKHALIRDAAYEALLKSRRRDLHRLVAQTIEEKFPALKEEQPEVLARHWTEAGEIEPAIAEWGKAGNIAEGRNAFKEALEDYQQAVAVLNLLPETHARDLRELELRQSIVRMLYFTNGYSAPETIDATRRAEALAEKSDNISHLVHWTTSRGQSALFSGDLHAAAMLADQAFDFVLRDRRPTKPAHHIGNMHLLQLMARYVRGDLAGVEKHFTAGLEFFDDPRFQDLSVVALAAFANASWNAWMMGRADVARERGAKIMAAANQKNPYYVAAAANCAADLQSHLREYGQAEALAARVLELSQQHRFPYRIATSRCVLGHARAQLGRAADGIPLIRQGIAGLLEMGTRLGISADITFLAAAQEKAGATDEALVTIEQALRVNPVELFYRPETLRLRGELRLKQRQTELAEADFHEAITLAQTMSAKAWELRATMSLARLLSDTGQRDEAHAVLAEMYNQFTEGFDTVDLKEAKVLLDQLAG